ncbi:MAG: putative glycoside hydrolase [Anaerolineae bacterium]
MKGIIAFGLLALSLLAVVMTWLFYLDEKVVLGIVSDELSGLPLAGAVVTIGETVQATDAQGRFRFQGLRGDLAVSVQAEGYLETRGRIEVGGFFAKELPLEVILRPNLLIGTVRDGETGEPVPGAKITIERQITRSDARGSFTFRRLRRGATISIVAPGYEPGEVVFQGQEAQEVLLRPRITAVEVKDEKGSPIAEAVVSAGEEVAEGGQEGVFFLRRLKEGAQISVLAEGYYGTEVIYEGLSPLEVVLQRSRVVVVVYDLYTGQPLPGVLLSWGDDSFVTDAQGQSQIEGVKMGDRFQLKVDGYQDGEVVYGGEGILEIALRPDTLQGVVRDGSTGTPIPDVVIQVGERVFHTDANGGYYLTDLPAQAVLTFRALGFKDLQVVVPHSTALDVVLQPLEATFKAKGIYITFGLLASEEKVRALIDMVARTELNAIVVDIKGDSGRLAYPSENPLALEIGAELRGWMEVQELLRLCRERGIYTIARLVVFKDSVLAKGRPDWAVKRPDGALFTDGKGSLWVDPFREEVWEYNIAIAREVAALGFDELQFDYIRFPTDGETGSLVYSQPSTEESRYGAIRDFMAQLEGALEPFGVFTSADLFGLTAWLDHEANIGQMVENVAPYVDYLSPMLYPSTFTPGLLHWEADKRPTEYPYEVVYESLIRMRSRTDKPLRPWLQHYADYRYHLPFGLEEYRAQREAAYDAGADGWLFWNASGIYEEELFQND